MPCTRHAFHPSAEWLEDHVLLSSTAIAFPAAGTPITETLTTDKSVYKVGQPIHITLTETNTTNAVIVFPTVKGLDGFTASHNLKQIWKSKETKRATPSFTLQPGETHTIRATWNGRANVGSASHSPLIGTFQVDSTLANNSATIVIDPRHGKGANAGVTSSIPNEALTLTS